MRGHLAIQELRLMGKRPVQVWVFLMTESQEVPRFIDPEDMLQNALMPEIWIEHTEDIHKIDFRFLAGVIVHLQGENINTLRHAYARINACKPKRIIASGAAFFDTDKEA